MRSPTAPSRGRGAGQKGGGGAGTLSLDVRPLCSSSTCSACASVPNTIPSSGPRGGYWQPPGQYSRAAGGGDSEQSKEAGEEEKGGAVEPRCVSPGPNCLGIEQTSCPTWASPSCSAPGIWRRPPRAGQKPGSGPRPGAAARPAGAAVPVRADSGGRGSPGTVAHSQQRSRDAHGSRTDRRKKEKHKIFFAYKKGPSDPPREVTKRKC